MNIMDLFIKIGVVDQASRKVSSLASKLSKGLGTAAKVGATAVATTFVTIAKQSIEAYAQYEQLEGGIKKLFGEESMKTVLANADKAYKTAGMSANKYLETTTSFSASLIKGLNGDTAKAAEYADMAIRDMADNANTFGTDISMIQNAYQGFAKQNYTMLDNLRLGYGGTASEMARLINDSGVLGDTVTVTASNINRVSFDKVVEAINKVQERMGISGTTEAEASGTLIGSFNAAKSAWDNLMTAMVEDPDKVSEKFDEFVASAGTVWGNLEPSLGALSDSFENLYREKFPGLSTAIDVLSPLVTGLGAAFASWKAIGAATKLFTSLKTVLAGGAALSTGGIIAISIGVITAAASAFIKLMKDEESRKAITDFWQSVADAVNSTQKGFVQSIIERELEALNGIRPYLSGEEAKIFEERFGQILKAYGYVPEGDVPNFDDFFSNPFEYLDGTESTEESYGSPKLPELPDIDRYYPYGSTVEDNNLLPDFSSPSSIWRSLYDSEHAIYGPPEPTLEEKTTKEVKDLLGLYGHTININIEGAKYNSEEELAEAVVHKIQQMIDGKEAVYD